MKPRELTTHQHFALLPKHCLIDRIKVLILISFGLTCLCAALAVMLLKERQKHQEITCVYQSTVDLDSFKQKALNKARLRYLGLPSKPDTTTTP